MNANRFSRDRANDPRALNEDRTRLGSDRIVYSRPIADMDLMTVDSEITAFIAHVGEVELTSLVLSFHLSDDALSAVARSYEAP